MKNYIWKTNKFWPLFLVQLLGAFNDNLLKNACVILISFKAYTILGLDSNSLVALASGIFVLPFFLFSGFAGQIADKYSKSKIIQIIKFFEIIIMVLASLGFYFEQIYLLLFSLFLMGLQSTLFGPVKYSILPELLQPKEIVMGNAYFEFGTFLSILLGTIAGGVSINIPHSGGFLVVTGLIIVSIFGYYFSIKIPKLSPTNSLQKLDWNIFISTWKVINISSQKKSIFNSILGISWFWFLGVAVLSIIPGYTKNIINGNEGLSTLFLAIFSAGIGLGALISEKLGRGRLELGLVPIGSLGLSLFLLDLYIVSSSTPLPFFVETIDTATFLKNSVGQRIIFDLFWFSLSAGVYIVPLYTFLQIRSAIQERSKVIASNNILNAIFMVASSFLLIFLYQLKLTTADTFLVFSILNVAISLYIYTIIPEYLFRFLCYILANLIYRMKVKGADKIPDEGAVLLCANHVTYVDWLVLSSACYRPIRFVMHYKFLNIPFCAKLFKDAQVIPIASKKEDESILNEAFQTISVALDNNEVVLVFPEGELTRDGSLGLFRSGIEKIIERNPVPIIPIGISGLWGSVFSRFKSKALKRPLRKFWSRIEIEFGDPIDPAELTIDLLKEKIYKLKKHLRYYK